MAAVAATSPPSPAVSPPASSSSASPQTLNPTAAALLLHHISFNQDASCFAASSSSAAPSPSSSFSVFSTDPYLPLFRRSFPDDDTASVGGGGVRHVAMLFRSNILAVVFGGTPNKVMIWDEHQGGFIGELSFRSDVKSVKLRRDRIVVIVLQKVFVYNFADLRLLNQIETLANPRGLCELSQGSGEMVMVCLGTQKGQIRIENSGSAKRTRFVNAHDSRVVCLGLSTDGRFCATASGKGTLVRVFNTLDGSLLQEVRRGADRADIHSLAFSSTSQWLAVSSDKGTVHVFGLKDDLGTRSSERSPSPSRHSESPSSVMSSLSFMRGVLPKYFSSEWSVAQFHLHEGLQYIVAFGHQKNTVLILGRDGSFYRCQFDPINGGEMNQLEYYNFLKPDGASQGEGQQP
ncbi:hypothetical protein MLD38_035894 [Melastoma candidum]|uniref:Uncharacterized protein n=1 Tax=Melastoma candidum TaxID=119954 RepID=A0ACB9LHD9_9MYRT|nr:hypothetical protein MLD38_035894 [Melastoma candidum]